MLVTLNPQAMTYDYSNESAEPAASALDVHLLRQVATGDEGAFEMLYRRHAGPLYNYLLRLIHEPPVAEDLVQEVFMAVWRGAGRFRGQAQVKTWLFHIAHNQAVSWLRRHRPVVAFDDLESSPADDMLDESDERVVKAWQADQLQTALEGLSPKHREVIELAFVYGLSYAEIAQVAACPVGTVKSRMSNALRYLYGCLRNSDA